MSLASFFNYKMLATYLNIIFRCLVFGRTMADGGRRFVRRRRDERTMASPPPAPAAGPPAADNGPWHPSSATVPSSDCLGTIWCRHCLAVAAVADARYPRRSLSTRRRDAAPIAGEIAARRRPEPELSPPRRT